MAVESIARALEKYKFELIQIEFVDNHFHFIIRTVEGGETISRIMQYIKARIAERFNRAHGRIGPFWNERFKSTIVEESLDPQNYFIHLAWHIAYNPVRKGLLQDPRKSTHGTVRSYLEEDFIPKIKITPHRYFLNLGKNFRERARQFTEYERSYRQCHARFESE